MELGPFKVSSNQDVPSFHCVEDAVVVLGVSTTDVQLAVGFLPYAGQGEHNEVLQPPQESDYTRSSRLCNYCNLVCTRFLG